MNAMLDLKEPEYDEEIYIAKNIFQVQDGLNDPYAMHKAVESLPVKILFYLLFRKVKP